MSFEKAAKFCGLCYDDNREAANHFFGIEYQRPFISERNRSLETCMTALEQASFSGNTETVKKAEDALKICRTCDFKSPRVSEFLFPEEKRGGREERGEGIVECVAEELKNPLYGIGEEVRIRESVPYDRYKVTKPGCRGVIKGLLKDAKTVAPLYNVQFNGGSYSIIETDLQRVEGEEDDNILQVTGEDDDEIEVIDLTGEDE